MEKEEVENEGALGSELTPPVSLNLRKSSPAGWSAVGCAPPTQLTPS